MRPDGADFTFALGVGLLATGLGMIYFPLALITVGLALMVLGYGLARRQDGHFSQPV